MRVAKIEYVPFNGDVFNLTVLDDESYVAEGLIVHNCRCTVHTLSQSELEREGLIVQKGKDYHNKPVKFPDGRVVQMLPDPGWDFNPGKEGLARV